MNFGKLERGKKFTENNSNVSSIPSINFINENENNQNNIGIINKIVIEEQVLREIFYNHCIKNME